MDQKKFSEYFPVTYHFITKGYNEDRYIQRCHEKNDHKSHKKYIDDIIIPKISAEIDEILPEWTNLGKFIEGWVL